MSTSCKTQNGEIIPGSTDFTLIERCLHHSHKEYLFLRDQAMWANQHRNYELAVRLFSAAANYAELFHSGFFVDPVAENELLKIGQSIDERYVEPEEPLIHIAAKRVESEQRALLHVISEISTVGGLWRTLINWIVLDPETRHSIVVLRQRNETAIKWLGGELQGTGTQIITLDPEADMMTRAIQLRQLAQQGFSATVNHVGQAETIPSVAFATVRCPPVLYVDHADHSFWLGMAMTDIVVHQRPVGGLVCDKRRGGNSCFVLPIPLETRKDDPESVPNSDRLHHDQRTQVRTKLGISPNQVMALSIGRRDKYRPMNKQNFLREAVTFLENQTNLVLHIVGVDKAQAEEWTECTIDNKQIVFHGEIPVDPQLRLAADLYLESYPFGSQTAFLEAAQAGLAGVRAPVETALLATSDAAVDDLIAVPENEREYWNQAASLARDADKRQRLSQYLRANVNDIHTGNSWKASLKKLYHQLDNTDHCPKTLPTERTQPVDHHDVALHRWHRWRSDEWTTDHMLRLTAKSQVNAVMRRQTRNNQWHLMSRLALRSLLAGRGDRTILKMGLESAIAKISPT